MKLTVAHTPDPDDAFMFYAMVSGKVDTSMEYEQVIKDIETLNYEARTGMYDVSAISASAYSIIHDTYALTRSGASFGLAYGPMVVARSEVDTSSNAVIGSPGPGTSSELLYRMFVKKDANLKAMRFDTIPDQVKNGLIDAGIVIHDEQLTFQEKGLIKIVDLYQKWKEFAGDLPLPLGFNAIRKSLGKEVIATYIKDFENSIKYAMNHVEEAARYAMKYARYSDLELETKFIRMYVNDLSVDFGEKGRKALEKYYGRAYDMGLVDKFPLEIV
ncbi:MAG: ABC transporter substrate-binding protein [Candidatus Thermoplasmatota archaeon]|jgi:1,4-dihydroxy-6-naphthoate synthase|nr:ABC transporter substrate-binding protein [Candidatus Thermoplasmatota archaeon]MCL5988619.1 ABC transporter substrate-binding protein [Candidatus Thermoplasmatota archaeon]